MHDATAIELGSRIRALRVARRWSLDDLACEVVRSAHVRLTRGQVGKIELGAPRTQPGIYQAIARALGTTLAFGGEPLSEASPRAARNRKRPSGSARKAAAPARRPAPATR